MLVNNRYTISYNEYWSSKSWSIEHKYVKPNINNYNNNKLFIDMNTDDNIKHINFKYNYFNNLIVSENY